MPSKTALRIRGRQVEKALERDKVLPISNIYYGKIMHGAQGDVTTSPDPMTLGPHQSAARASPFGALDCPPFNAATAARLKVRRPRSV
jgi:hypothetical protein